MKKKGVAKKRPLGVNKAKLKEKNMKGEDKATSVLRDVIAKIRQKGSNAINWS